jgi:hypothetical protein
LITAPVAGNSFDDFVATMGSALDKTADEVARVAQVACGPAPVTTRGGR